LPDRATEIIGDGHMSRKKIRKKKEIDSEAICRSFQEKGVALSGNSAFAVGRGRFSSCAREYGGVGKKIPRRRAGLTIGRGKRGREATFMSKGLLLRGNLFDPWGEKKGKKKKGNQASSDAAGLTDERSDIWCNLRTEPWGRIACRSDPRFSQSYCSGICHGALTRRWPDRTTRSLPREAQPLITISLLCYLPRQSQLILARKH